MLSKLPLMSKIEPLLQFVYNYYYTPPKYVLDKCKLAEFFEHKVLKTFHNVKTLDFHAFSYQVDFDQVQDLGDSNVSIISVK